MFKMGQTWSQMYPPPPIFTEKECPDLSGKVFIITGGYSGVGFELAKILYQKNATVYIAGRSQEKGQKAINEAKASVTLSTGRLKFIFLDLSDLKSIKGASASFLSQETRLDVLWNNAGVMMPPDGLKTKQGYELQLGTNCVGPFLFTQLLRPILARTAALSQRDSVRVCWTSSLMAELSTPSGIINFEDINLEKGGSQAMRYGQSKAGNILLGSEFAKIMKADGVISLSLNPGNLKTDIQRHAGFLTHTFGQWMLHPTIFGAYTELYAGISPEITFDLSGSYIIPWGRVAKLKAALAQGMKSQVEGGTGVAERFYKWCEGETSRYM